MAVKLYSDASCTTEVVSYANLFSNVKLSPFTKTPTNDNIKIYAKKESNEAQEHFALRLDSYSANTPTNILEASIGPLKSLNAAFTKISDGVYSCEEANKFAVGDFVTISGSPIVQITAISGNQITLEADLGNSYSEAVVTKLLPLGDTTNPVEITINRSITYKQAVNMGSSYYYYYLNTFWEE